MGTLGQDRVVRTVALALVVFLLPLVPGLLSPSWRFDYGKNILDLPFLVGLVTAFGLRARAGADAVERRFWTLLAFAFLWWLSGIVVSWADPGSFPSPVLQVLYNGSYLLFYGCFALALEIHPRVGPNPPTGRLLAIDRAASALFLFGVLMYFLVLPRLLREEAFWASSVALYVALNGYLVLRLVGLRQATPDVGWRAIYGWLLTGAVIWSLGDAASMLMVRGVIPDPGYGTFFDAIYPVAYSIALLSTRADLYQPKVPPVARAPREPLGMGPVIGYAVLMPLLHLLAYRFSSADQEVKPAREMLVLATTAVLGSMAFVYHRLLRSENRRLTEEEERARERLAHLAFHDELTGLPNREMLQDHLRLAIADARRYRRSCAVLFCDLDRFKVINDSLGHEAGDQVLVSTAERLKSSVRVLDTVARFGGDEFTIILHGIGGAMDAARLAEKMLSNLGEPVVLQSKKHVLTASVGIAVFPDDGEDESTLLRHADTAMYQAKLHGRNTYRLFTEAMNEAAEERLAIEEGLRTGSMDESFVLLYQPIVGIVTGEPAAYEALLRWRHPERGLVAPESFLDVAEQSGLIVPIGQWVVETACKLALSLQEGAHGAPSISVNVSARELQASAFVQDILAILERTGLPPSRLQLEITEAIALDVETTGPVLAELRAEGIQIVVDNFGTGFAALSRLRDFPVDVVKIDRSFVRGIEADSVGETIVRAIVTMARALDFYVVAEGVETEAELEVVKRLECDAAQGFHLQAPLDPAEMDERLRRD